MPLFLAGKAGLFERFFLLIGGQVRPTLKKFRIEL